MIPPPAARTMLAKNNPDCGAAMSGTKGRNTAVNQTLNRCLAVTDKRESTWQKRTFRCKGGPLKSVCRELPGVPLAASMGPVYRLRMNRFVQAY
jgi:hypothetical protein